MGPIRKLFDTLYWQLTHLVTPGLLNAQHRYIDALEAHIRPGMAWLDLGCGHQLVPAWIAGASDREAALVARAGVVVGVDLDLPSLVGHQTISRRAAAGVEHLPFADNSFDLVTANMVVEHMPDPAAALAEIHRVLKPGGVFLFHTPNSQYPILLLASPLSQAMKNRLIGFFEARHEDDVFPTLYRMNHPGAIEQLAHEASFDVRDIRLVESSPETVMLGPLVVLEMLFIRLSRIHALRFLRSNIITMLSKSDEVGPRQLHDLVNLMHAAPSNPDNSRVA